MAETIIELAGPHCETIMFGPTGEARLRGRWTHAITAGKSVHESLAALHAAAPGGVIPGLCLGIDPRERRVRRFDPMHPTDGTADGKACWAAIEPILKRYAENFAAMKPWNSIARENVSDDELKTWIFYARKLIDEGLAVHASGPQLPSLEDCKKLPGAVIVKTWMGGATTSGDKKMFAVEREAAHAGSKQQAA